MKTKEQCEMQIKEYSDWLKNKVYHKGSRTWLQILNCTIEPDKNGGFYVLCSCIIEIVINKMDKRPVYSLDEILGNYYLPNYLSK
jgi:hypothetical protein